MSDIVIVTVVGPLRRDELDELLGAMKRICDRRPEAHFTVIIDDSKGDMAQAERAVRALIDNPVIQRYPRPQRYPKPKPH